MKDLKQGARMGTEPIAPLILSFAAPAVIGMIAGAVYNIVDRVFVGQFVGSTGLAAITVSFPSMLLMVACAMLVSVGSSSRVAILYGAGRRRAAEQALATAFTLMALFGGAIMLFSVFGTEFILRLSGADGEVLETALPYIRIILFGAPLALAGFGINALVRACGSPRYAMMTQIIGAAANVALDALFIIEFKMGVTGAALGTVIAQAVSFVVGIWFFQTSRSPLKLRAAFLGRLRWKVVRRIFLVGSAPFFMETSFVVYMTLMNQLIVKYGGTDGLSAMGIFFSLDSLLFLPAIAIGEASQPIIGYNFGAGMPERVRKTIFWALSMAVGFYLISMTAAELFAKQMIELFTSDPALIAIGVPGMRVGYMGVPFMGVTIVTNCSLQGLGLGRASLGLSFLRYVFCMFLPVLVLPRFFGLIGVWMSFPTGDVGGCIFAICFLVWMLRWLKSPQALKVD